MSYCGYLSWPPATGTTCEDEAGNIQERGHVGPCRFVVPRWVKDALLEFKDLKPALNSAYERGGLAAVNAMVSQQDDVVVLLGDENGWRP